MEDKFLQDLVSFIQQKGFVWGPEPEIYGGLSGFYTYGPLGKLLKNNVENAIRSMFIEHKFSEVECPTIMPAKVWEASGHLKGFSYSLVVCDKCKSKFKVDGLLGDNIKDYSLHLKKNKTPCPSCGAVLPDKITQHDLMMKTQVGADIAAYNRPETATTTYLPFLRYYDYFRKKLPFGVFQIGNAYRNEISPRQHVLRTREFTQAEAQMFIFEDQKNDFPAFDLVSNNKLPFLPWGKKLESLSLKDARKKFLKNDAYAYTLNLAYQTFIKIGIPANKMRLTQHSPDSMVFYADDAWDVEINLNSFGWTEVCGVHDRTNYDLTQHGKASGVNMEVLDANNKKQIPHILEIAFGTARSTFAILDLFYDKKTEGEGKSVLRLPSNIAPYKIAILPLSKKPELQKLSKDIMLSLRDVYSVKYDETASIGKRYLRASEEGTPYCITVDFDSLKDDSVTIRDRDSEEQKRVKISSLKDSLNFLIEGGRFSSLK